MSTVGAAEQLQPDADLPPILGVPPQGKQADVFSSEGVVEDIPLHLMVVPVSRQGLNTEKSEDRELLSQCSGGAP